MGWLIRILTAYDIDMKKKQQQQKKKNVSMLYEEIFEHSPWILLSLNVLFACKKMFGLNNIYFIILYMYNYYIATRNDTQYNEWGTEEIQ